MIRPYRRITGQACIPARKLTRKCGKGNETQALLGRGSGWWINHRLSRISNAAEAHFATSMSLTGLLSTSSPSPPLFGPGHCSLLCPPGGLSGPRVVPSGRMSTGECCAAWKDRQPAGYPMGAATLRLWRRVWEGFTRGLGEEDGERGVCSLAPWRQRSAAYRTHGGGGVGVVVDLVSTLPRRRRPNVTQTAWNFTRGSCLRGSILLRDILPGPAS